LFDELMLRIGARFRRVAPRRRVRALVLGLLAGLPPVNCWSIAEHAGDATPAGMQHLLSRARWDTDGVRDDVRSYVVEHLGDPDGMLVVDETGDVKKGTATAGVQRQSMMQAIRSTRPGGHVGYVGVPHGVELPGEELFFPCAPARRPRPGPPVPARADRPHLEPHDQPGQGLRP
jgi:hypothetical protein